ncbi:MAG: insulinase family protein [Armatimonadetes bacterium]|nr:insulinase family protein [Armatimonadota bacterium]
MRSVFHGRVLRLLCLLCLTGLPHAPARAGAFDPHTLDAVRLPNGLRVVTGPGGPQVSVVSLWVRAGSRAETEATSGASALLQRLLARPDRPDSLASAVEGWGGALTGDTSRDWMHLTCALPHRAVPDILSRLRRALSAPPLAREAVEAEKAALSGQIAPRLADPEYQAPRLLARQLFGAHPYRLSPTGTPASLRALTPDRLRRFARRVLAPANCSLILLTLLPPARAKSLAARALGTLPRSGGAAPSVPAAAPLRSVRRADVSVPAGPRQEKGRTLGMAFRAAGVKGEVCALDILLALLGEGPGSRLSRRLQAERGWVRSVRTDYLTQRDPGMFVIMADLAPGARPAEVESEIAALLRSVAGEGVTEDEVRRARQWVRRSYRYEAETLTGQAAALGFYEAIDTYRFAVSYLEQINRVTAADVRRAARAYLTAPYARILMETR